MPQIPHNISAPNDGLGDQLRSAFDHQNEMNTELYGTKVDKILGKDLSENDFTDELKEKLENIPEDGFEQVPADFNQTDTDAPDFIKNKPGLQGITDISNETNIPLKVTTFLPGVLTESDGFGHAVYSDEDPSVVSVLQANGVLFQKQNGGPGGVRYTARQQSDPGDDEYPIIGNYTLPDLNGNERMAVLNIDGEFADENGRVNLNAPTISDIEASSAAAVATANAYTDAALVAVYRGVGDWDASVGTWPLLRASGSAIKRGDTFNVTVAGTISGRTFDVGDAFYANQDTPGQTSSKWSKFEVGTDQASEAARGTLKISTQANAEDETTTEDLTAITPKKVWFSINRFKAIAQTIAGKFTFSQSIRTSATAPNSMLKTDSNKDIVPAVAGTDFVAPNTAIVAGTKTKIQYDSKGLVLSGSDATTDDIAEGARLYFMTSRVLSTALTGISFISGIAITATDTVLIALGKLQKQITDVSNNYVKVVAKQTVNSSTTTGTTAEVILSAFEITAGEFVAGNQMNIYTKFGFTGVANTKTIRIRINTTNALSGSTQVAINTVVSTSLSAGLWRIFDFEASNIFEGVGFAANTPSDNATSTVAISSMTLNPAATFWVILTGQLTNSADGVFLSSCTIQKN